MGDDLEGGQSVELYREGDRGRPLVPDDESVDPDREYVYNSDGTLADGEVSAPDHEDSAGPVSDTSRQPFSHAALDGSWYVQLHPRVGPGTTSDEIHGAMRIESRDVERFRVSGDVYIESRGSDDAVGAEAGSADEQLAIGQNRYPQFPPEKYGWYFRSQGVRYSGGRLSFDLERHVWDPRGDDFTRTDTGTMTLNCRRGRYSSSHLPTPTIRMTGKATFGGRTFTVTAVKTSSYYRGCHVEADVMANRQWTGEALSSGGEALSFSGVYRDAGLEFRTSLDSIDVPEDASLSTAELHRLLSTHRTQHDSRRWHLWLLIGSQYSDSGALGVMFDDAPPYREGAVSFYDPRFSNASVFNPDARGKKIGEVPLAILRTALHEIGHAVGLFHPKHDVHSVPVGTTVMNQTGDVMGFASESNPYPNNATFAFHDHNAASLVHSPDPQVRPGWKRFGYGHGGMGNSPSEPADLIFDRDTPRSTDLDLELSLPDEVYPGEFVLAAARLHNVGDETLTVPTALNLEEDYLSVYLTPPDGEPVQLRDVLLVCSDRTVTELEPGDYRSGYVQLTYTNREYTFDRAGQYTLQAELDLGGRIVRSDREEVLVRSPLSEEELELSSRGLDTDVGRSIALGVPPVDTPAEERLTSLADEYPETDIGTAAAIVVATARRRDTVDYRGDEVVREADEDVMTEYMDVAFESYTATDVARIATAVVPVSEAGDPIFDRLIERARDGSFDEDDVDHAAAVIDDYQRGVAPESAVGPVDG